MAFFYGFEQAKALGFSITSSKVIAKKLYFGVYLFGAHQLGWRRSEYRRPACGCHPRPQGSSPCFLHSCRRSGRRPHSEEKHVLKWKVDLFQTKPIPLMVKRTILCRSDCGSRITSPKFPFLETILQKTQNVPCFMYFMYCKIWNEMLYLFHILFTLNFFFKSDKSIILQETPNTTFFKLYFILSIIFTSSKSKGNWTICINLQMLLCKKLPLFYCGQELPST